MTAMRISTKLFILVSTALLGVVAVALTGLYSLNASMIESRRYQITNLLI
jgi:ABC-type microcin C transport system permease subunit YejE